MNWLTIDTELFHFMRPQWLWLFAPLVIVFALSLFGGKGKYKWKQQIAPHLLPYVIKRGNRFTKVVPLVTAFIALSCMIIAVAGPTWKKIEVPGTKSEAILLIALDLSPSMLVEDVSPNRLERAKFKIRDLLDADPGAKVGLLAYSGTSHPVVTPSSDYKLITYQLQSLSPQIMPLQGCDYDLMLTVADTMLTRTDAPSTLLIITDNIEEEQADKLIAYGSTRKHHIEIISLATIQGGEIPGLTRGTVFKKGGKPVISHLDQNTLYRLQQESYINVNPLTLGNEDVELLVKHIRENLDYSSDAVDSEEDWEEMGFMLLWFCLCIIALWFRKGWMITWCLIIFIFPSCKTDVNSWDDIWYEKDYQGQMAMDVDNFEEAALTYESLSHKGVAYYKNGDFESAIEIFKLDTNATSMYNLGLAYAANGQNDLAMEVLELALELDPSNKNIQEASQRNNEAIAQKDTTEQIDVDNIKLAEKEEEKGDLNEIAPKTKDEELSADNEVEELPDEGDRITDEQETEMRKADEMESPPENFEGSNNKDNAQKILLREISADPSEFLKRRFKYQKEKYYPLKEQPEELW